MFGKLRKLLGIKKMIQLVKYQLAIISYQKFIYLKSLTQFHPVKKN